MANVLFILLFVSQTVTAQSIKTLRTDDSDQTPRIKIGSETPVFNPVDPTENQKEEPGARMLVVEKNGRPVPCESSQALKNLNSLGAGCFRIGHDGAFSENRSNQLTYFEQRGLKIRLTCVSSSGTKTDFQIDVDQKKRLTRVLHSQNILELDFDSDEKCFDVSNGDLPKRAPMILIPKDPAGTSKSGT